MEISIKANGDNMDYSVWILAALENYDLHAEKIELIRHNENITLEIFAEEGHFILRIRKPREGFSIGILDSDLSPAELLASEVDLLHHISKHSALSFQEPIQTKKGDYICDVYGYPACVLRFINGTTLSKENVNDYADQIGILAAEIHLATEGFDRSRYVYSHRLLATLEDELTTARNAFHIKENEWSVCKQALDAIDSVMTRLDAVTGLHLIHCDLGMGNILLTDKGLTAIDFSLCGYGYRAMECGMLASNFSSDHAIERMRLSYNQASGVNVSRYDTDAFLALSVLLFITCQHTRYFKDDWFIESMKRWTTGCIRSLNWGNAL